MGTSNKGQSSSVRCLWLQFNVAEIKKPPGAPAAEDQPGVLLVTAAVAVFTPFFASFRCALRVIFEVTPAMLATFTTCF
jgi:hypothetical protein